MNLFLKRNISLIILIALSVLTVLPLFHLGFFNIHDDAQIQRVFEMKTALSDGMFPVRWVADLGYGYGYPIFNFYGPLPYYVGAIFSFFIKIPVDKIEIVTNKIWSFPTLNERPSRHPGIDPPNINGLSQNCLTQTK